MRHGISGDPPKLRPVEPRPQEHGALEVVGRDGPLVVADGPRACLPWGMPGYGGQDQFASYRRDSVRS